MSLSADLISDFTRTTQEKFKANRTVMSFHDYLFELEKDPKKHLRGAAQYFSDMFKHFGSTDCEHPSGVVKRWNLFDAPFDRGQGKVLGQERIQNDLFRNIENFVKSGRCDRLVLLHGPNGSAKTSIVKLIARAAEVYSELDEGAIYRFNWVFPAKSATKGNFGFSQSEPSTWSSYAHLPDDQVESRVTCELNDHPFLLMDREFRKNWLEAVCHQSKSVLPEQIADIFYRGDLSLKNRKIFQALLTTYLGDLSQVLRHVQVERFYFSQRYRTGLGNIEPQMSVDAYSRQITMDQSIASLPSSLKHVSLFEAGGPIVNGNRGMIDYNDLLKRPIEAWKYLLVATELGQVSVDNVTLFFDSLMLASSNELHLQGFREYPDWQSFKGRFELVKVPYLLRYSDELEIYRSQIPHHLQGVHIAPQALEVAARWAVLTRLEAPIPENYPQNFRDMMMTLTPLEKLELYDTGVVPERLTESESKELRSLIAKLFSEFEDHPNYEGRYGASPREIRTLILTASQNPQFDHLSPIAVINGIEGLVKEKASYEFLRRETLRGFQDAPSFVDVVRKKYLSDLEETFRSAVGLVDEESHRDLLKKYIQHVSAWTKGEKLFEPLTKKMADPDLGFLERIERILLSPGEQNNDFRRSLISKIGAHVLEQPEKEIDYAQLFSQHLKKLKNDYFKQQNKVIEYALKAYLIGLREGEDALEEKDKEIVNLLKKNLYALGYNESSAKNAISYLQKFASQGY